MTYDISGNIHESAQSLEKRNLSMVKFILLIFFGFFLSFGIFSLFAPVLFIFANLLYGRKRTLIGFVAGLFVLLFLSQFSQFFYSTIFMSFFSYFVAGLVSEVIFKNYEPVKGLLSSAVIFVGLLIMTFASLNFLEVFSFDAYLNKVLVEVSSAFETNNADLIKSGNAEVLEVRNFLKDQSLFKKKLYQWSFSIVFVYAIINLWVSFFIVLKNSSIWRKFNRYSFEYHDFLKFSIPTYFVYLFIGGLACFLASDYILGEPLKTLGGNLLYCTAVIYFFHGVGIYLDLLDVLKINGLIKIVLVTITVLTMWKILVLLGVFNFWLDFPKIFKKIKKNKKGDKL